jgi:hypothetical protein
MSEPNFQRLLKLRTFWGALRAMLSLAPVKLPKHPNAAGGTW